MLDEKNRSISASLGICSREDIIESNRMSKSFWYHSYVDLSLRKRRLSVVKRLAWPLIGCYSCRLISRRKVNKSKNDGFPITLFIERRGRASASRLTSSGEKEEVALMRVTQLAAIVSVRVRQQHA